jgi:hypothetical protein
LLEKAKEVDALRREVQQLRQEAEYFKWLRGNIGRADCRYSIWDKETQTYIKGSALDDAILEEFCKVDFYIVNGFVPTGLFTEDVIRNRGVLSEKKDD